MFDGNVFYAVMPYPGCQGCTGTLAEFDALTSVSSHELCEAITDPVPGQGWYDDVNGEIGDICAWQTRVVDGYTVQLEWSNASRQRLTGRALGVLPREVGQAGDGWLVPDGGVGPVVIVLVEPCWQGVAASAL